ALDALVEAAELAQELTAPFRVELDEGVFVVLERRRLLQDRVGQGELADVVEQAADREAAQAGRRQTELLAYLDREGRDPARVLLGRGVLLRQAHHERPDTGAEERLLGDDDLGC